MIPTFLMFTIWAVSLRLSRCLRSTAMLSEFSLVGVCRAKLSRVVSEDVLMSCTVFELPEEVDPDVLNVEEKATP